MMNSTSVGSSERTMSPTDSAEIYPFPPGLTELPLPEDYHIENRQLISQQRVREIGRIIKYEVTISDGTRYEEQQAIPEKQSFERGVTFTVPWCTRLPGFNTDFQKLLAAHGMASDLVGPPKLNLSPKTIRNLTGEVQLAKDAAVQHELFSEAADQGLFRSDEALAAGYSRGAMITWGLLAYEKAFQRDIKYFDSNDPCLVRPPKQHDVNLADIRTYTYVPRELRAAAQALGRRPLRKLIQLPRSLEWSLSGSVENIATGIALFKGQAGAFLPYVGQDKVGSVRLYEGSIFNQSDELEKALADHRFITILRKRGYHLSGMRYGVQLSSARRIWLAQRKLQEGESLAETDFSAVSGMNPSA